MHLIGLTGGIASGKTLVSDRFAELGAPVIDADLVAREVVEPGSEGLATVAERFGASVLTRDGALDRAALRGVVFADPGARRALDALLHPLIRERADRHIERARAGGAPYAIYAIPLLVETGQTDRFDRILVVDTPRELQIERLLARDGGTRTEALRILGAQASREARLAVADDVIINDGPLEATLAEVDRLDTAYRSRLTVREP